MKSELYFNKLKRRRSDMARTLEHVQKEHRTRWRKTGTRSIEPLRSRCDLLENLEHWYTDESRRIDDALLRIAEDRYGDCLGCGKPIAATRLEAPPTRLSAQPATEAAGPKRSTE